MTMRKILILIFCLFAAPLWAGPADALLDKLAIAKTKSDADSIVRSIWIEWLGAYNSDRERQLMDKGIGAMDKKRFKQAEAIFTSILKSNPDFTEAWNKRATVRFLQGDFVGFCRVRGRYLRGPDPRTPPFRRDIGFGIDQHASERT